MRGVEKTQTARLAHVGGMSAESRSKTLRFSRATAMRLAVWSLWDLCAWCCYKTRLRAQGGRFEAHWIEAIA